MSNNNGSVLLRDRRLRDSLSLIGSKCWHTIKKHSLISLYKKFTQYICIIWIIFCENRDGRQFHAFYRTVFSSYLRFKNCIMIIFMTLSFKHELFISNVYFEAQMTCVKCGWNEQWVSIFLHRIAQLKTEWEIKKISSISKICFSFNLFEILKKS